MARERITEIKGIDIDHECKDNPVYLTWVGPKGGRNYWLFHKRQKKLNDIKAGNVFNSYVSDLEDARSNSEYLSKDAWPQMEIGADNVPVEKIRGIASMLRAVKVEMLMNPTTWESEGPKWQTVKVLPGTFEIEDTGQSYSRIEVTIEQSFIYLQSQ